MRAPAVWARAGGVRHSAEARATAREGGRMTARRHTLALGPLGGTGEGESRDREGVHARLWPTILNFSSVDWELPFSLVRAAFFN